MDTKTLLVLILGLVALTAFACGVDDAPASGASLDGAVVGDSDDVTTPPAQTVQEIVDAPIHSANVLILEMFPPLYRLEIESGLPNGCHSFNDADVSQDGNTISVHVTNTEVTASNGEPVACAMVYGIANNTVELPGSYANGEEFTVDVNGTVVTFIGQSPATSDITDSGKASLADLIYAGLQRMDPEASRGDEVFQEFFRAYGEAMQVVDGSIQVFTFADEAMAQGAASGVSSDASEIKGVDGSISMPMWIGTPHFYINGATITIYVGENVSIAGMLADRAGEQFAVGSGVGIVGGFLPPAIEPVPPTPPKIGIKPGYVTREAPIESASVVVLESLPAQYRAHVVFGLPNGCLEYAGSPVSVDSHGAHIQLLLQRPEGDIACTDDYRQDKVAIDLHGPFISGQKYDFCVNGTFVGQDDSGSGPIMAPQDPDQYKTEVAPIESVSVQMVGEGGLDYAAVILVGLPNGCYQLGGWSASRSPEDVTRITVETRIPNQDGVACTEIYRTTELKVPLKGGFAAGTMYTLDVNGTVIEFEGRDEGRDTEAATSEPLPLAPALGATELVIATVLDMEVVPSATSRSGLAVRVTSELPHSHAMLGEISIEPGRGVGDVDVQVFNEILLNPSSLRDDTPKKVENVIDMDIDLVSGEVYQLVTLSGHPAVPFKAP